MVTFFFVALFIFVSGFVVYRSMSYNAFGAALISSFLKIALCILALHVSMPFSGADAETFERLGWEWSQDGLSSAVSTIDITGSYLISSIVAIIYSIFGREISAPVIINGLLGVLIFYYSLVLAREVWGEVSNFFPFLVALHPMLNIHSAIILRENYIVLFLVLASISLARYARKPDLYFSVNFIFFVILASFFHGAMIVYAAGLPLFVVFGNSRMKFPAKLSVGLLFAVIFSFVIANINFGKLSAIQQDGLSVEYLAQLEETRREANTAYLVGMAPSGFHDVIWQAPIRSVFLLTKPFPWDIRNFGHLLVFFDALLWWFVIYLVWKNRVAIKNNPAAFAILISCLISIVAFAYGTSNYGTGVRHRTKFIIMALVLVSPFIPRIRSRVSHLS